MAAMQNTFLQDESLITGDIEQNTGDRKQANKTGKANSSSLLGKKKQKQ